ncbi:MAG TPA: Crp/Fnr family transcriptional regulator [Puia sp.]|uniref:Crp/Fnr family transcriptional regulator n=1 Tax=Puia sp. TaxID=2045100 RepID=UPI002C8F001C|nr:Crp/Fnr family transcriptional regulator [Puia sp.]HVU98601.1 Crp/Fnr family transcriptional regulator [Puia sp.]
MSIQGIFPIEKWDFKSESILADLPKPDLQLLMARRLEQIYKKGEIIFREETYATGTFYLVSGKAKKYKVDKDGREQIIYVANAGELLGFHAILSGDNYPDSAAVMEESLIAFIPREDFLEAIRQSDVLNRRLLKTLSHEFVVLTNNLALFAQRPVRERLALQLIVIREKYKAGAEPGMPVEINMSRDDLASLVGTARENVVRLLSGLREEGIVETKGRKIIVLDLKRLIRIANQN